jgi:hypothetical protein
MLQRDVDQTAEISEWVGELVRLWDAVGKPLDASRLEIYQRELGDIPLGLLRLAISRVIRENTYSNVPPVGTIWAAVRKELGDPHDLMQSLADWVYLQWQPGRVVSVAVETESVYASA